MSDKIQRGLFERTVTFYGRHADIVEELVMTGLFGNNHEAAEFACMAGIIFNKTAKVDKSSDHDVKIGKETMRDSGEVIIKLYRFAMLLHDNYIEYGKRLERAFAYDDSGEDARQYEEIVESYIRGGLDILNDKIFHTGPRAKGHMREIDFVRNEIELLKEMEEIVEDVVSTKRGMKPLSTKEILENA